MKNVIGYAEDKIRDWLRIGVSENDGFLERRKIQVSNFIFYFIIGLNLFNAFIFGVYYYQPFLLWDAIITLIIGIGLWAIHSKGNRVFIRHFLIISATCSLLNLCVRYGDSLGLHYYLLFVSIISFLIFDSWWIIALYSVFGVLGYMSVEVWFGANPLTPNPNLDFNQYPNMLISFCMILFVIYIFKKEATDYQYIVEAQNKDLSNLTVKMMFQKDEALMASNQLKRKSKILEQQNQSIVESLQLASLLQKESLPLEETLFQNLKSGFLIYRAMQVVSGDFYWGKSTFHGQIIVAADCIGHGVPGGMMAILSANLISQIVEDHGKTFPSDILAELSSRLRRRIKQDAKSEIGDGMDIAIVLISDNKVSFSSASRPLLRISATGQVQVIPGNRFQLASGNHQSSNFETIEIDTKPGDRFFLFTDGITDQFSEKTGKRLGTKRFVEEITQLQHLPLSRQKPEIEAFLTNWQDNERQTDDMLLIGFEV